LQLIVQALKRRFGVTVDISPRDDLLVHNKYKVSGSAARITRHGCYHHLTLLVDIDTSKIGPILTSKLVVFLKR
jgi:lipoyltransferase 1